MPIVVSRNERDGNALAELRERLDRDGIGLADPRAKLDESAGRRLLPSHLHLLVEALEAVLRRGHAGDVDRVPRQDELGPLPGKALAEAGHRGSVPRIVEERSFAALAVE